MNYLKMRNNFRVILALRVALKSEGDRANIPETVSHCLIIIALSLHDSSCKIGIGTHVLFVPSFHAL